MLSAESKKTYFFLWIQTIIFAKYGSPERLKREYLYARMLITKRITKVRITIRWQIFEKSISSFRLFIFFQLSSFALNQIGTVNFFDKNISFRCDSQLSFLFSLARYNSINFFISLRILYLRLCSYIFRVWISIFFALNFITTFPFIFE